MLKKKHNKFVLTARTKLGSIENIISKAVLENEIIHEEFTRIINEERNYHELRKRFRMMESQRINIERHKITKGLKEL